MNFKRNKVRITRAGMLYERRIIALRRLQARQFHPHDHQPTGDEVAESRSRWEALKHKIL